MIRLLAFCLIAAFFTSSCVLDNDKEKPNHLEFQLDPVLAGLTRVEIFRLNAQGAPIAPALFNDSLRTPSDVANLDARGYGGGSAVFSVKGYKGAALVYEIKVSTNGKTTTVQEIKLIPFYTITLKVADPVDLDKDGYKSAYNLVADVNTNLAADSILLRYFWKPEGSTVWGSRGVDHRFKISKLSAADAVIESMAGGEKTNGTAKVEAYNQDNVLIAEMTLDIREETGDQDDPGFHFLLVNNTGAFMEASLTVDGKVESKTLPPKDSLVVDRDTRPDQVSYYAAADGGVVIWEATVKMVDNATYRTTLVLAKNTDEFFVLTVINNSTTVADRIVIDQGLATQATAKGPVPGDGVSYNIGVFNYSPTATVSFFNDSTGKAATVYPLQFDISPTYGYRYASVTLSSSNWADPSLNLFSKNWKLIGAGIEPGMKDTTTGAVFTDVFARMQGCARDGIMTFNANGTFTDNEGPTKCDDANPQSIKGTWSLNASRTLMTMKWETDTAATVWTVEALTPTTLKLSDDKQTWDDGKVHNLSMTFSAL